MKKFVLIALLILMAAPYAMAAPAWVQQQDNVSCATVSICTLTFGAGTTAGNFIFVLLRLSGSSPTASGIVTGTNCAGGTAATAQAFTRTNSGQLYGYYFENIAGGVTQFSGCSMANTNIRLTAYEYSGVATSSSLDVTGTAVGTSVTPSCTTSSSAVAGSKVAFVGSDSGTANTYTLGSGYANLTAAPSAGGTQVLAGETQNVSGTGTFNGQFTITSAAWTCGIATFKAASAGGTGGSTRMLLGVGK